jgi:hypothetical protein
MMPSEYEEKIRGLANSYVSSLVAIVRAIERQYGREGKELARRAYLGVREGRRTPGDPSIDLHEFCDSLDRGCRVTHQWVKVVDEPNRVKYNFTKCMWAEAFSSLNATDIGHWFCDTDEPAIKAYNPRLGFKRTKTLMDGDAFCDHEFYVVY